MAYMLHSIHATWHTCYMALLTLLLRTVGNLAKCHINSKTCDCSGLLSRQRKQKTLWTKTEKRQGMNFAGAATAFIPQKPYFSKRPLDR